MVERWTVYIIGGILDIKMIIYGEGEENREKFIGKKGYFSL